MGQSRRKVVVLTGTAAAVAGPLVVGAGTAEAAAFNVTNLNDSGAGSLRQAIADANSAGGADVITFQAGLSGTITLTSGQLEISDSVTIQGPGAAVLAVSGNSSSRVFYLYNNSATLDVTISGITVTDGLAGGGGGISVWGENLTLRDAVVTGNESTDSGGGVYFNVDGDAPEGSLRIYGTEISENTAGGGTGGGIFLKSNAGAFVLADSEVTDNSSVSDGGGIMFYSLEAAGYIRDSDISHNIAEVDGGGIALYGSGDEVPLVIERSTIDLNIAYDEGGGLYLWQPRGPVTISQTTVSGNRAVGGEGGGDGGGIYFYDLGDTLTIRESTISGNSAESGEGGGIYINYAGEDVLISSSTISGNDAYGFGGGLAVYYVDSENTFRVENSTIVDNTAGYLGGGIALYDGEIDLDHTIVANNSADGGNLDEVRLTAAGDDLYAGGAIYADWSLIEADAPTGGSDNLTPADPLLGPLADNGGPTQTHLPLAGSPVINAGDPAFGAAPATDQRGVTRIEGGRVDVGAVETTPTPVNDAYVTTMNVGINQATPGVLFNDGAASGDEAELVSGAAHGLVVLNANGSFTYTPNPGYVGPDQFVYRVLSGDVELGTATVSITVNGAAGGGQIPATGTGSLSLTLTATGLLGAGMALSAASRRRRPA